MADKNKTSEIMGQANRGTVSPPDFRNHVIEFVRQHNQHQAARLECSLNKNFLDFGLKTEGHCPVTDPHANNPNSLYKEDSLVITNNSKKSYFFEILNIRNYKMELTFSPTEGELKKGKSIELKFQLKAFCTTTVYKTFKIAFYKKKLPKPKKGETNYSKFEAHPENIEVDENEIGRFFMPFKLESELSNLLDFDELTLEHKLAKGGFGTVFRGKWRGTPVAIKQLNVQELVDEELALVKREITLMSKLNHQHIVTYMGSTQVPRQPLCIVMEFIEKGSLSDLLLKDLTDSFRIKLAQDIAAGMNFLHASKIYHRDIKPDNMLVVSVHEDAQVNLKITDFGTSKASAKKRGVDNNYGEYMPFPSVGNNNNNNNNSALTPKTSSNSPATQEERQETRGVGTLVYSAPEVLNGEEISLIDKTDIFSYGVLLWQLFTRKEPFADHPYNNYSKWDIEKFVIEGKRLPIPSEVPKEVASLITDCVNQEPRNRPTFGDIQVRLKKIADGFVSAPPQKRPSIISHPPKNLADPDFYTPKGPKENLGWVGEASRGEAEMILKTLPPRSFLLRWSVQAKSYVLSFKKEGGSFQHIAYINPQEGGRITVDKEDKTHSSYDSLYTYIDAMKESLLIDNPIPPELVRQEANYSFSG